ncbi:DUF7521 family protein [Candidatus Halobonum tyrrellensis]|uniref:Uncharacterized protein n=1 Tax=Candidatus Halobonum tyrrellensis G22 TaxID=1324957 RepID=V4J3U3_9EURY|nr:hypothetical protein [Candidatus Halobonum tyrrellensis]ESP90047.1 hypothetical protein K933_00752 [Candidatus Halobonum tyrrellensis G22]
MVDPSALAVDPALSVGLSTSTAVPVPAPSPLAGAPAASAPLGVDAATLLFVTAAVTALLGGFVAWLAYRGYRRNGSRAMRLLAVGVVCFTVVPFLATYGAGPALGASDAATLLGVLLSNVVGLLAVLYSLDGT